MRTISTAFLAAALAGGLLSSCYVAQPNFECQPPVSGYWVNYTVNPADADKGACAEHTGDVLRVQRYLPPGTKNATIAVLTSAMGTVTRARAPVGGALFRVDPSDPTHQKETARGPLTTLEADAEGVCKATLTAADQDFPAITLPLADGGTVVRPAVRVKYDYQSFRFLNTARFPGSVVNGEVTITENDCTARYTFDGIWPPHGCDTDVDCDPNADLDAGRSVGSGLSGDYKPVCGPDGVCISTVAFDELKKLD